MKYVLFSDIHGNYFAFKAMLDSLSHEKIDGYLFCGDLTGYYYQAEKIVETIKHLPNFYAVRGNHDTLYLEALHDAEKRRIAIKKYGNSYNMAAKNVTEYLHSLPEIQIKHLGNYVVTMLHGSPKSPLHGRIYPDSSFDPLYLNSNYIFLGHTHYQMMRSYDNYTLINPGSLGQPRDGRGFSFYVVDFDTGHIKQHNITFDLTPLLEQIARNDPEKPYLSQVLMRNRRNSC